MKQLIPEHPDNEIPKDGHVPKDSESLDCEPFAATTEYAPATCTYKGVSRSANNASEAAVALRHLFQCEKETFDSSLVQCIVH